MVEVIRRYGFGTVALLAGIALYTLAVIYAFAWVTWQLLIP